MRARNRDIGGHSLRVTAVMLAISSLAVPGGAYSQGFGAQPEETIVTARSSAPVDLTGQWVSLITENWRFRMVTAPIGDYTNIPMTAEGRRVALAWDPAADVANGEECRAFGAPGIMRLPTRLQITWADDETLRIDADFGEQTRFLHFQNVEPPQELTWQGHSRAEWEFVGQRLGAGPGGPTQETAVGGLKVITDHLRPGYLRRNGVPYSSDAILTEYFDHHYDLGEDWILHTRIVEDPIYLNQRWVVTSHFKRETDDSKWNPQPCRVIPPPVVFSGKAQESRDPENPAPR